MAGDYITLRDMVNGTQEAIPSDDLEKEIRRRQEGPQPEA
jgi:hypothetical protein